MAKTKGADEQTDRATRRDATPDDLRSADLRDSPMMAHLLDALEAGTDIGHYGRLVFAMVARHFLDEEEMVRLLGNQPGHGADEARALLRQMETKDYNPPKRDRILAWQAQQEFPICPTPDDPTSCNVYSELRFPDTIYDNITDFYVHQEQQDDARH
jgi:hypothetical protein